jgi:pSer/pThr/pTyr-binding forkhead associated (FHA) protein
MPVGPAFAPVTRGTIAPMPVLFDRAAQRLVRVQKSPFTIGRDVAADLDLPDATVSRQHAMLLDGQVGWIIRNQSRINPVQVNGAQVVRERALKDGDKLRFGAVLFEYRLSDIEADDAHRAGTQAFTVRSQGELLDGAVVLQGRVASEAGAADAINLCHMGQVTGVMVLNGSYQAKLWLHRGQILKIQAGTKLDADAIALLGNWDFTSFEVREAPTITRSLPAAWSMTRILLEIGRLVDARLRTRSLSGTR